MLSCPAGPAQVCNYLLLGGDLPGAESVVRTTFAQTSLNMTLTGLSAKAPRQGATLHNGVTESQAQVGQSLLPCRTAYFDSPSSVSRLG